MAFVFNPKPAFVCTACPKKAIRVCNCEKIPNCKKAFCVSHGLFPPSESIEHFEVIKTELSHEFETLRQKLAKDNNIPPSAYRQCYKCYAIADLKQRYCLQMMTGLFILVSIIVVIVISVMVHLERRGAVIRTSRLEHLYVLSLNDHIESEWMKFRNLECSGIEIRPRDKTEWNKRPFTLNCHCSKGMLPARHYIRDAIIVGSSECQYDSCPADGENFIRMDGRCSSKFSYSSKHPPYNTEQNVTGSTTSDGRAIQCPLKTRFNLVSGACHREKSPSFYFSQMHPDFRMRNCPLFTFSSSVSDFCIFEEVREQKFQIQDEYRTPIRRHEKCPSSSARAAKTQNGQDARVVDEFGYYHCPVVTNAELLEQKRACQPEEMTLVNQIGCSSPCKPCQERWDFALMKSVRGETECSEFGHVLLSNGECHRFFSKNASLLLYQC